ncbi:MAG: hypothetical protein ACYCVB_05810 [Bacilli bacterium]
MTNSTWLHLIGSVLLQDVPGMRKRQLPALLLTNGLSSYIEPFSSPHAEYVAVDARLVRSARAAYFTPSRMR